jgi:putative DNA primase/helicase
MTTINLSTGENYAPRREDYITKQAGTHLKADCKIPLWQAFLSRVTAGDKELQAYLQRMAGYCMTGITREHVLFFCYGSGANGKGVFLNTLTAIWGDYATVAPMEMFIETHGDRHPTELAFLRGARLVVAQEIDKGKRWAESKIKALTGGDPITARFMRADFFTFVPQFKLVIAGNHKPSLRSVDEAMRRRFHLVPFIVTIPEKERDPELFEKLKAEWPGILQWAIDGCLEWQKQGLSPPAAVRNATEEYLTEEDAIANWINECCDVAPICRQRKSELYASWNRWAEAAGEYAGSHKALSAELEKRGFKTCLEGGTGQKMFSGIGLKPIEPKPLIQQIYE